MTWNALTIRQNYAAKHRKHNRSLRPKASPLDTQAELILWWITSTMRLVTGPGCSGSHLAEPVPSLAGGEAPGQHGSQAAKGFWKVRYLSFPKHLGTKSLVQALLQGSSPPDFLEEA